MAYEIAIGPLSISPAAPLPTSVTSLPSRPAPSSALRLTALLGCALLIQGCRKPDVEKASLDLAKALAADARSDSASARHASSGAIRVYIDASRSMQGFAGCSGTPTKFNTTLDRVTSDLSVVSVTRFGERARGSGDVFEAVAMARNVHCPAFYDRLQNPDYALFKTALDDSAGSTYLYFTDGVQSDWQGSNPGPSLAILEEWLKGRRALAILAFRSNFTGQAWSEQAQRMVANINTPERPFYLFILTPSDLAMDAVLGKLSAGTLASAKTIRFGQDAVSCKVTPGQVPKYKSTLTPPWSLIEHAKIAPAKSLVVYQCDVRAEYPIAQVRPRVVLEYRSWSAGAFSTPRTPIAGAGLKVLTATSSAGGSATHLEGALPFDPTSQFGFYGVRIHGEPDVPRAWVDSLSVDSDVQPSAFSRTYRFSWLIERLARTDLGMRAPAVYGLTIKYR